MVENRMGAESAKINYIHAQSLSARRVRATRTRRAARSIGARVIVGGVLRRVLLDEQRGARRRMSRDRMPARRGHMLRWPVLALLEARRLRQLLLTAEVGVRRRRLRTRRLVALQHAHGLRLLLLASLRVLVLLMADDGVPRRRPMLQLVALSVRVARRLAAKQIPLVRV